jgi:predicted 2-oxoglutarate/Fe(II)-dependent dioxygenase YbiX
VKSRRPPPSTDSREFERVATGVASWALFFAEPSVVYFLNDDFSGGELFFPVLDLVIQPEAGTLVCFPSDHDYIHGVRPVTSGRRYTVVTWMRVKGMPSVDEINQMATDEYHRMWPKQIEQHSRLAKGGAVKC